MPKAFAVIGANYGDEGKGQITDWLGRHLQSRRGLPLVIRANGGAQAGHTVTTPEGSRHVFSHFGSGTFIGAPTCLARTFITNPLVFIKEKKEFRAKFNYSPSIPFVDPECIVTTPYDMLLNEAAEETRGDRRHGSVGLGINETVERCSIAEFSLKVWQLGKTEFVRERLQKIRDVWVPQRAKILGADLTSRSELLLSDDLLDNWMDVTSSFLGSVYVIRDRELIRDFNYCIFEGAQGLGLDQDYGVRPYVTRSHTGLHNPTYFLHAGIIDHLQPIYVTRPYLTRHGAGPLPREQERPDWLIDETNKTHTYQGAFRYAPLELSAFWGRINRDLNYLPETKPILAVTCLDQMAEVNWYHGSREYSGKPLDLANRLEASILSWGLTRNHVSHKFHPALEVTEGLA